MHIPAQSLRDEQAKSTTLPKALNSLKTSKHSSPNCFPGQSIKKNLIKIIRKVPRVYKRSDGHKKTENL